MSERKWTPDELAEQLTRRIALYEGYNGNTHIVDHYGLDDSGRECTKLLCGYLYLRGFEFEGSIHSRKRICKKCMKKFIAGEKFESFYSADESPIRGIEIKP